MHILLTYGTVNGSSKTIRVPHASPTATDVNVRNAAGMIINAAAINGRNGQLHHIRSAYRVEVQKRSFNV